jgi:Tol biopolymer transport system component
MRRAFAYLLDHSIITRALVTLFLAAVLVACSDTNEPVETPARPVANVVVSPATTTILIGRSEELSAVASGADGEVIEGRPVQWATSDASIATVSSSGSVTAVAEGAATISATIEGKIGTARVTVVRVPVATVSLTPKTVVLDLPGARQMNAIALDAEGHVLDGRVVQWSTDPATVATVSATGMLQAVAPGYALVTATIDGVSASSAITVAPPDPLQQFDLVYERRTYNGLGEIRRLSLANGQSVPMPIALTIEGTFIRDVVPSPDGGRVAFTLAWYPAGWSTLDGDIYVANIDGSGLRRLTTAAELDEQPAWSPDGRRIAFRSHRAGNWDIWVMNADGSGQTNLMMDQLPATATAHTPAWSPDGSWIVYASDLQNYSYSKLWTMRPDGRDKRLLLPAAPTYESDREPSWSPDGTRIAFRRIASTAVGSDIMIANVATGAVSRIAMTGVQAMPTWSPDGQLIAFTSSHEELLSHVYTMRPDGSGVTRYTSGADENTSPRWLRTAAPAGR